MAEASTADNPGESGAEQVAPQPAGEARASQDTARKAVQQRQGDSWQRRNAARQAAAAKLQQTRQTDADAEADESDDDDPIAKRQQRANAKRRAMGRPEIEEAEEAPEKPKPKPRREQDPELTREFIALNKLRKRANAAKSEAEALQQQIAQQRAEIEAREQALASNDPEAIWSFLREKGIGAREVIARAAAEKDGKTDSAIQPQADLKSQLEELLTPLKTELEQLKGTREKEQQDALYQQDLQVLKDSVGGGDYPYVADEPIEDMYEAVLTIYQQEFQPIDKALDLPAILRRIERNLANHYQGKFHRLQGGNRDARAVEKPSPGQPRKSAAPKQVPTINNLDAAPAVTPAPATRETLPWSQRRKQILNRHKVVL